MASEADLDTELLIRGRLQERFPQDGFLGEETGRDELAGCRRHLGGRPDRRHPAVRQRDDAAGASRSPIVRDGTVELGFVYSPARDELFVGRRGAGATLNGRPIRVSACAGLTAGMVGVGYSPRVRPDAVPAAVRAAARDRAACSTATAPAP